MNNKAQDLFNSDDVKKWAFRNISTFNFWSQVYSPQPNLLEVNTSWHRKLGKVRGQDTIIRNLRSGFYEIDNYNYYNTIYWKFYWVSFMHNRTTITEFGFNWQCKNWTLAISVDWDMDLLSFITVLVSSMEGIITATGRIGESGLSQVPITNTDHWCEGDSAYTSACRGPFFTYYVTYVPALYMGKNSK